MGRFVKEKEKPPRTLQNASVLRGLGGLKKRMQNGSSDFTISKNRCGKGLLNTLNFRCKLQFVVPTRTPLSLLIHLDIAQETNILSRLQKDYSITHRKRISPSPKSIKCKRSMNHFLKSCSSLIVISILYYEFNQKSSTFFLKLNFLNC